MGPQLAEHTIMVGLIVERIALSGPWVDHVWMPVQVLTMLPDTAPWTEVMRNAERVRYYAGAFPVEMHVSSTAQYRDNLASVRPALWVAMRPLGLEPPVEIVAVTADTSEGEGLTETGTNVVETVDMPPEIASVLADFIERHHVERVFEKRQRDKSQPRMAGPRGGKGGKE